MSQIQSQFGRTQFSYTGRAVRCSVDGNPIQKIGGVTLALDTLTAVSSDTTLTDGSLVKNGAKYLRYGQVLCRVNIPAVQTVTVANATGGTFTLTLGSYTTGALAYNATAQQVQQALENLPNVGAAMTAVSGPVSGVYTVTFSGLLGNVATMSATDSTTGSGHGVTVAAVASKTVQTITIDATGGTFTITYGGVTTGNLAYNASAATVQAALEGLSTLGAGNVNVSLSSSVYTITLNGLIGPGAITTTASSLTGGAGTAAVATVTTGIADNGLYGPYDPTAADGRAILTPGEVVIVDETWLEQPAGNMFAAAKPYPKAIVGGRVWKDRLIACTSAPTLAKGPTYQALLKALNNLQLVEDR